METLIVILVIIIIALASLCLKLNQERKPAPKEQIVIEVSRLDGSIHEGRPRYRAQIKDRQEIFATGDTFYDAVGELVNSNRKLFRVEYLDDITR